MNMKFARAMSTSAARSAAAPIPVFGISGNYAQAVYSAANTKNAKPQVAKDLGAIAEAMQNQKVADYMKDPFTPSANKMKLLTEAAGKIKMSPLTLNLFNTMAENNRLNLVAEVATIYGRIMQAEAGFTPVNVQTAVEMSAAQIKEVTAAVEAIIGGKGKVEVSTSVKKDIGGGLVVSIGDRYTEMKHIDLSTSAKVQKYSALLKQGM